MGPRSGYVWVKEEFLCEAVEVDLVVGCVVDCTGGHSSAYIPICVLLHLLIRTGTYISVSCIKFYVYVGYILYIVY